MELLDDLMKQFLNPELVDSLASQVGADKDQVSSAIAMMVPSLLGGMGQNTKTEDGLNSLMGALDKHANPEVKDINGLLGSVNMADGAKILTHLLGSKTESIESGVAKKSGLSTNQSASLLTSLAPLLLGTLGNQKNSKSSKGSSQDLGSMLSSLSGNKNITGMLSGLLDSNNDGNILDDVTKLVGNLFKGK